VLDLASKLRLDRRLARRRGWISADQLAKDLKALPDVAEKAEQVDSPQFKKQEAPAEEEGPQ
jgi:hypothetical protein